MTKNKNKWNISSYLHKIFNTCIIVWYKYYNYILPSSDDNKDSVRFLFLKLTRFEIVLVNEINLEFALVSSESFVPPLDVLLLLRSLFRELEDNNVDLVFESKLKNFNQHL